MKKYLISAVMFITLTATLCLQADAADEQQQATQKTKMFTTKEEALRDFLSNGTTWLHHFMTKHGYLKTVDEYGNFGKDTHVVLNGVVIFKAQKTPDGRQQEVFVHPSKLTFQESADHIPGKGPVKIDRILLSEGCGLNYVTQFILLDFTCDKPFVSERFGFNPGLKWHIHLGQVKWGKEKSYIDLDPKEQGRYVYYTCDRIEDITDDEDAKESAQRKKKTQQKQKPANKTHR
jgi:hypothetical protein